MFYFPFTPVSDQTFSFGVPCSQMVFHVCFPLFDCIETIPTIFVDYLIINLSLFVFLNKYCMSYDMTSPADKLLLCHCTISFKIGVIEILQNSFCLQDKLAKSG